MHAYTTETALDVLMKMTFEPRVCENNDGSFALFKTHVIRTDILIPAIGRNINLIVNGFNNFLVEDMRPYLMFSQVPVGASVLSMNQIALDNYIEAKETNLTEIFREYLEQQLNLVPGLYEKLGKMYMGE